MKELKKARKALKQAMKALREIERVESRPSLGNSEFDEIPFGRDEQNNQPKECVTVSVGGIPAVDSLSITLDGDDLPVQAAKPERSTSASEQAVGAYLNSGRDSLKIEGQPVQQEQKTNNHPAKYEPGQCYEHENGIIYMVRRMVPGESGMMLVGLGSNDYIDFGGYWSGTLFGIGAEDELVYLGMFDEVFERKQVEKEFEWDMAPKWAKYVTIDNTGAVLAFEYLPTKHLGMFNESRGGRMEAIGIFPSTQAQGPRIFARPDLG